MSAFKSVKALIDARAEELPDRVFLCSAETGAELTYGELRENCVRISAYLTSRNVEKGQTVAFLMDNGLWTTCLFLGVMYSGRVILPLNAVAGPDQIEYVIEHSELKLIFCADSYGAHYAEVLNRHNSAFELVSADEDTGIDDLSVAAVNGVVCNESGLDDTALMIYTSGTTGRPKGVLLSHQNVIAGGRNTMTAHNLSKTDRGLCVLPLYHINAEMVSVMAPLVSGSCVVMSRKLSISKFWHWIQNHRCTWFSVVPTIISYLIEQRQSELSHADEVKSDVDFDLIASQVKFGRSASAALSPATHQDFEKLFSLPIIETMGISECAAQILSNPMQKVPDCYGSPGIPIGNEMRIVDSEHNAVLANVRGELAVRGDNIMKGYFKNPTASKEALDAEGWFYTGDLGYCDENGYYFVTGRSKELIIRGGENIAPREIDDVLYKHPGILEAAAFGVPDTYYGQEVLACVSLKPEYDCNESILIDHCRALLGDVKSPKRVHIISELPKGPSGKIQRLKLADRSFD